MTLKPPTRTLPKLVMKEWPEKPVADDGIIELYLKLRHLAVVDKSKPEEWWFGQKTDYNKHADALRATFNITDDMLSDFTRVVEETRILDQERSQKDGSRHD